MINIRMMLLCLCLSTLMISEKALAQNKFEEVLNYKETNGYIIVNANVGGKKGNFILDIKGGIQFSETAAKMRNITADSLGRANAQGFFVGENLFRQSVPVKLIKNSPLFDKLGVDGIISVGSLTNAVLTINSKVKTISISNPYRPSYMKIENRQDLQIKSDGVNMDFVSDGKKANIPLVIAPMPANSFIKNGVVSLDFERGKYYFQPFGGGEATVAPAIKDDKVVIIPGKVNPVDRNYFLANIYDYRNNKEWKTIGNKPVVIDFWASWCGPCLRMMPIMEELAAKYKDKIIFYKVNVDKEGELRDTFKANTIPLVFFAPVKGEVIKEVGADSKEKVEERLINMLK